MQTSHALARRPLRADRARPRRARVPEQARAGPHRPRATSPGRGRCTRSSTAASTGIRPCTATGCWRACCGARRMLPSSRPPSAPGSTHAFTDDQRRRRARLSRAPGERRASSGPTAGPGFSMLQAELEAHDDADWPPLGRRAAPARARVRATARRLAAEGDLSDPRRHARLDGLRARPLRPLRAARRGRQASPARSCAQTALRWYGADVDCPAWEPSGQRFPLASARRGGLHGRVAPGEDFAPWLARFLPRLG